MKRATRKESQNRVIEAVRRLKGLLELEHPNTESTPIISYYKSNLMGLEREIETARSCGYTSQYINGLLDQLQPVRDHLFKCELAFIKQEQGKINHRIELTRAFQELSEALENTGLVKIGSHRAKLFFTFSGFLKYQWVCFINNETKARYIICENYDLEYISRLFLRAKERLNVKL